MKVFINVRCGSYSGGMILVAANTKEEAIKYINNFYNMTNGKDYDSDLVGEGIVYSDIYKQGNRKTCATLPFRGLEKVILDSLK